LARLDSIKKTNTENFKVAFTYSATPARYVLERRAWEEAAQLPLMRPDFLWDDFSWAQTLNLFARGIGAARSGKIEQAKFERAKIKKTQASSSPNFMLYISTEVQVQYDMLGAWIRLADGADDGAIALAKTAADLEDSLDKHPVTPGEVLPARELYGDLLLETGDYEAALTEYETALQVSPNRLNALLGAQHAAAKMGATRRAKSYADIVREQVKSGDREIVFADPN